jgi:hypothetical protein
MVIRCSDACALTAAGAATVTGTVTAHPMISATTARRGPFGAGLLAPWFRPG